MTPLATSYRAALSTAARDSLLSRRRPQSLPGHTVVVHDHVIGEDLVASYGGLFRGAGALDPAGLPSVLVHIAGFPAAMDLMAQPDFPLPLLGMVHLENLVRHHRPVPAGVPLEVVASATNLAPHPAGTTVDVVVTVHGPGGEGPGGEGAAARYCSGRAPRPTWAAAYAWPGSPSRTGPCARSSRSRGLRPAGTCQPPPDGTTRPCPGTTTRSTSTGSRRAPWARRA